MQKGYNMFTTYTTATTYTANGTIHAIEFTTCPMDSIKGAIANAKAIAKARGFSTVTVRCFVKDTNELVATVTDYIG